LWPSLNSLYSHCFGNLIIQEGSPNGRTIWGEFDIKYMPRTAIKGQVLADLVAELIEYP